MQSVIAHKESTETIFIDTHIMVRVKNIERKERDTKNLVEIFFNTEAMYMQLLQAFTYEKTK